MNVRGEPASHAAAADGHGVFAATPDGMRCFFLGGHYCMRVACARRSYSKNWKPQRAAGHSCPVVSQPSIRWLAGARARTNYYCPHTNTPAYFLT